MIILKRWLPAIILCLFIFTASAMQGATVIEFFPSGTSTAVAKDSDRVIHKVTHYFLYMALCLAFYRATKKIHLAILLTALYGVTDEFHQLFVPTRSGKVFDILVDSSGGITGGLILWKFYQKLPEKLKIWLEE